MEKENDKPVFLATPKRSQTNTNMEISQATLSYSHERIKFSAVFWHLLLFFLPSYAVWQGLFFYSQAWYSIIIWLSIAVFFLFFVAPESLILYTAKPRTQYLQDAVKYLNSLFLWFSKKIKYILKQNWKPGITKEKHNSQTHSIFGNYANDGKSNLSKEIFHRTEEDGITIEDYLRKRKEKKQGIPENSFNWNWQQNNTEDSLYSEPHPQKISIRLYQYLYTNWQQDWQMAFLYHNNRSLAIFFFWLVGLLWLPVSYGLLRSANDNILAGYSQDTLLGRYILLIFINITLPILTNQVSHKLKLPLTATISQPEKIIFYRTFAVLPELCYSFAALLIIYLLASSIVPTIMALLLVFSGFTLRLSLQQRTYPKTLLWLLRQLNCISVSLGLLIGTF